MTTYAIGDIHGCSATLEQLLERIAFRPEHDRLWLVGDLVNRGPRSLDVLRFARRHEHAIVVTLGNHDLHLLARAAGVRPAKEKDTLEGVLAAPDRDELLDWLRRRPLLHSAGGLTMVHAGLHPQWNLAEAADWARAAEARLQDKGWESFLQGMYSEQSIAWHEARDQDRREAAALRVFAALRVCTMEGRLHAEYNGPPEGTPPGYFPWYQVPERRSEGTRIIFGHWAASGFRRVDDVTCLDSGCAWGKPLTGVDIANGNVVQVANKDILSVKAGKEFGRG